jgi:hypothetical protein
MPYLNISWWDRKSPTVQDLPPPLTLDDLAVQTSAGESVRELYGPHEGYLVSPYVSFVRDRFAKMMGEWKSDVPVDCVFFDQIGARPWRRDFNPAEPTPLAYDDGWLVVTSTSRTGSGAPATGSRIPWRSGSSTTRYSSTSMTSPNRR